MTALPPPTALIAEDEHLLAQALKAELARCWPALQVQHHAQDGDEAVEMALDDLPDVLFLDIRMPGRTGLEAAQAVVEDWPEGRALPLIVFVTAYDQYALQAFESCAVDYLLKPVQPARLAATCKRLQGLLGARQAPEADAATLRSAAGSSGQTTDPAQDMLSQLRQLLAASAGSGELMSPARAAPLTLLQCAGTSGNVVHMVPVEEVVFLEAADKYVRVITATQEHLIRTSLRELLPQLDANLFWQVHRGTIVQARAIERAVRDEQGKVQLHLRQRPEVLAVSRLYAPRFKGM
ncbi:MAG: DNA-binding response regulator [Burkholderiales bacterium PBB6]|nr:MAG: DNA-binding response regulator [Burkholderiales bacterium PBB6]